MTVDDLLARAEILDVLSRYCRAVDRRDADLLLSVYHHDAVDVRPYGPDGELRATPTELARRMLTSFADEQSMSQHHLTTVTIVTDLEHDRANAESYVIALHPMRASGPGGALERPALAVTGGRYLDDLERRDGRWAILRRVMVVDWSRADLPGQELFATLAPALAPGIGRRDPSAPFVGDLTA